MADIANAEPPTNTPGIVRLNADPLDWPRVPKPVKAKLQLLRAERNDARSSWRTIADERQEALEAKRAVEARLKALTGGRPNSPWYSHAQASRFQRLPDDDALVVTEREKLEDLIADLGRLSPLVSERSHRSQQLGRLVTSVEEYLGALGAVRAITLHKGPTPIPQKREAPINAVERCRRRLRELDADRHRIASAPWHAAMAKERARAEIEALAERGQPSVLPLIESRDEPIYWSERAFTDALIGGRVITAASDPPALPLLFWLHRDAIVAKVEAQIDAVADDPNALTAQQRAEQIGEIDRDRLAIQRSEEHWVGIAIHDGVNLLRRADADARAILNLSDDMPAPSNT